MTLEDYRKGMGCRPMQGLKTILSSVGEMRSCSRGRWPRQEMHASSSAGAEVNALGYSNAPDAVRFQ